MDKSTPFVSIDLDKVEHNITNMMKRLDGAGINHRPHIKPHKSIALAQLQNRLGAKGLTCATLSEAEVMTEAGFDDILIAFPIVGGENLERIGALTQRADIKTIVDSVEVGAGLSQAGENRNKKIKVLIEIDGGSHRGGVQSGAATLDLAQKLSSLPGIELVGLFTYVGQINGLDSLQEIEAMAKMEADILLENKSMLEEQGFTISITSGGSTVSSMYAHQLQGITESRAGNYIFFDMNAVRLGIIDIEQCALRVCARIVSTPLPGYATIDAGSKTLTSDPSNRDDTFGYIVDKPGVRLEKLNEEHGFLRFDPEKYEFEIGEVIEIIPNHSCVILNINERVYGFRKGRIEQEIQVDARAKNY